jgi:hypothetical protein
LIASWLATRIQARARSDAAATLEWPIEAARTDFEAKSLQPHGFVDQIPKLEEL